MARTHTIAWVIGIAIAPGIAGAQTAATPEGTPAERAALAEALFRKGKAQMADQHYDEACPMLAESERLDPGGGTLLTLALCHERQGKTATAWTEFGEAHYRAVRDHITDRETLSKTHADALLPKLSRLTIRVDAAAAALAGLSVTRDGIVLAKPAWGLATPADPGDHQIKVTAPGKIAWTSVAHVGAENDEVRVDVPALADEPKSVPIAPPPQRMPARTVAGLLSIGAGAIWLGVGVAYGVRAIVEQEDANSACPTTTCPIAAARSANQSANSAAIVADLAIPLGVVLGAAGAFVLLTAPKPHNPSPLTSWNIQGTTRGALATFEQTF